MCACPWRTRISNRHQQRTWAPLGKSNTDASPAQVFLTHLHSDHIADLATFYVGAMFGRTQPWHVWGPSGENATTGTAHSIEGLRQVPRTL
jgi:ribonuclease BN (tRNA processing enzyme)